MSWVRERLGYANVVATIALFVALGGGAYAVGIGKNSVKSKHIKDGEVRSSDVQDGGIAAADVAADAFGAGQVDEAALGQVPSARAAESAGRAATADRATSAANADNSETLDGIDSTEFVNGSANFGSGTAPIDDAETGASVLAIPGIGTVEMDCRPSVPFNAAFRLRNTSPIALEAT